MIHWRALAGLLLTATALHAAAPSWTRSPPEPVGGYTFFVGSATTEEGALRSALTQILLEVGGPVSFRRRVLRHDELTVGESEIRFSREIVVSEKIKKIADFRQAGTTWVLVCVPTRFIQEERQRAQRAKRLEKHGRLYIAGGEEHLINLLQEKLSRSFTVCTDSTNAHVVTLKTESREFSRLGMRVAYQVDVLLRVTCQGKVVAARQFSEFGKGWDRRQAEAEAFSRIAVDIHFFLTANL